MLQSPPFLRDRPVKTWDCALYASQLLFWWMTRSGALHVPSPKWCKKLLASMTKLSTKMPGMLVPMSIKGTSAWRRYFQYVNFSQIVPNLFHSLKPSRIDDSLKFSMLQWRKAVAVSSCIQSFVLTNPDRLTVGSFSGEVFQRDFFHIHGESNSRSGNSIPFQLIQPTLVLIIPLILQELFWRVAACIGEFNWCSFWGLVLLDVWMSSFCL